MEEQVSGVQMSDMEDMEMMMMQMTFYVSKKVTVLFDIWDVKTTTGIVLTTLFWVVAAFVHQGLKRFRVYLNECSTDEGTALGRIFRSPACRYGAIIDQTDDAAAEPMIMAGTRSEINWKLHLAQTVLQVIQTMSSYLLMLVVMTYNVWLCVAVVAGDALGYMYFQRYSFDNAEHCN